MILNGDRLLRIGCDLRELELKTLRDNIALVTHEPWLFQDSLEENIRYGNRHATAQDIRAAARAADIHDFILSLPQGYQTVVGEKRNRALRWTEAENCDRARDFERSQGLDLRAKRPRHSMY